MTLAILGSAATSGQAPRPPQVIDDSAFSPVTLPTEAGRTPDLAVITEPMPAATVRPVSRPRRAPTPRPVVVRIAPRKSKEVAESSSPGKAPTVTDAKAYALSVLGSVQYACLDQIAIHESHWNPFDLNRSSGAYGIPQALPGSKMAVIASDWRTNPVTQIKWMIRYVNGRYGSACEAWAYWRGRHWY